VLLAEAALPEMNPIELRQQAALDAATQQIRTVAASVADRVSDLLGTMSLSATRISERDLMLGAQFELRRNMAVYQLRFKENLRDSVAKEIAPRADGKRRLEATDWHSLSLVDDQEVEQRMQGERIGALIMQECEAEQRELAAYMGDLLRTGKPDEDRNPLRPNVIGAATYFAIEAVTREADTRKLMAREIGQAMAKAMKSCYAEIVRDLQSRGVKPASYSVRTGEGPGYNLPGVNSAYDSLPSQEFLSTRGQQPLFDGSDVVGGGYVSGGSEYAGGPGYGGGGGSGYAGGGAPGGQAGSGPRSGAGGFSGLRGSTGPGGVGGHSGAGGFYRGGPGLAGLPGQSGGTPSSRGPLGPRSGGGGFGRDEIGARAAAASAQADAQLMNLLRRLTFLASRPGELDALPGTALGGGHPVSAQDAIATQPGGLVRSDKAEPSTPYAEGGLAGMMAVNLIRAHREELMQASSGKLDHMVIDVVGSLFDQILSDPRVPPQMARQIARLQLPVLRVAMNDATFFSSRRHPVRRFVNRIASLACAFDEFDDGPGRAFLARVRELVQEIVEGDFDQIELYTAKLAELESFIGDQTQGEVQQSPAAATLESKESELRIQQRYMLQLSAALKPMQLPEYLRDFLSQVWSQALVLAVRREGPASERFQRFKRAGRDVVMSVQPKGSPVLRKRFLMQLPQLMKDLNEGMALIGWPEAAQKAFFAQLLPAHAESLKSTPLSELDHNMMAKGLEGVFNAAVPGIESLSLADEVPAVEPEVIEKRFTEEEAKQVGLVAESAVDWSGEVDIPLDADAASDPEQGDTTPSDLGLDINLDISPSEPPDPVRGPQLMDHIKLGFAYQMHLKDEWQKVRLTYVSPGRSFFVFSRGKKHQETISMTARMLARMCETGRMKAFENAYLMERATQRARKQLAALKANTTH
jgi:Protein of unknown function (DUF1631)